jgi:hypothetical protein
MAPMPQRVKYKHDCHQADTGSDHAQCHIARELMLHDQRHGAREHQQEGQPAEAMVAVAMMVVAMVMAPMPGAAFLFPGVAVLVRTAFVQRKFIAHTDIEFAHSIFLKNATFNGRRKNIIIKSSNINMTHQKIIMLA